MRIYLTECDSLKNVGGACRANGIGMTVCPFIKAAGISTCAQDLNDLTACNGWGPVKAVIVGKEAISNGYVAAHVLFEFISTVSQALKNGPTTRPLLDGRNARRPRE